MKHPRPYQKNVSPAEAIAGSQFFHDYRSAFTAASGLDLLVLNPDGTELASRATRSKAIASLAAAPRCVGENVPVHYGNRIIGLLALVQHQCPIQFKRTAGRTVANAPGVEIASAIPHNAPHQSSIDIESFRRLLGFFALQLADWFIRHASSRTLRERPRLVRMIEWLEKHFHEPITLSDAAKEIGLSPWAYSKNFLELSGVHFRDMLCQIRVSHAKRLLADPRLMIHQIAASVGFRSISQFNRVFGEIVGCTAGEFRRKLETENDQSSAPLSPQEVQRGKTAMVLRPSVTPIDTALSRQNKSRQSSGGSEVITSDSKAVENTASTS